MPQIFLHHRRTVFICILASMGCVASGFAADEKPLIVGILNQQTAAKTAERWNPILKYLTDATGIPMAFKMGQTVQDTNAMMARGEFDLVFTNHNFRSEFDGIYKPIARWSEKPIYGVIAVLAESPARTLHDLSGRKVVFPSRTAFVGYAVPMAALKQAKVPIEPIFAAHQEGALAQLKARQVDAAAVNSRFLTQYAAQSGLKYREVFISEGYADLPVSIHPRVPATTADELRNALLNMRTDPKALPALAAGSFTGFHPAMDRDYDNARKIYKQLGE